MRHHRRDRTATSDARRVAVPARARFLAAWLMCALLCGLVSAQGFTGRFAGDSGGGRVELTLEQTQHGLVGALEAPGVRLALDGDVSDGVGFGYARADGEVLGFEVYLEGDVAGLYVFELDAVGNAIVDSAIELILTRVDTGLGQQPGASAGVAPPFDAAPPSASTFDGVYADDRITLDVRSAPGGFVGEVGTADQRYMLEAVATPGGMRGTFAGNGIVYDFAATFDGDVVHFETGGSTYRLVRRQPSAGSAIAPGSSDATIVARGTSADLSLADATAFLDAFEFVLEQVGYAYRISEGERAALLQEFAQSFPSMAPQEQIVLAQSRAIWERVQVQWPNADDRDRREFMLGVLVLAFGQETVSAWVGPQGSGGQGRASGSALGCTTFDSCTQQFVDERTWTDTFNAQGCWGAAGCESYDSSTGTFTYSDDW